MEYWSIERKIAILSPSLQYSNTPKLFEIKTLQQGSPYFGS